MNASDNRPALQDQITCETVEFEKSGGLSKIILGAKFRQLRPPFALCVGSRTTVSVAVART
jgi:hypothetical protein